MEITLIHAYCTENGPKSETVDDQVSVEAKEKYETCAIRPGAAMHTRLAGLAGVAGGSCHIRIFAH
jgi:hypothetical protein